MLARSRDHVGVLSSATGGDLARSERWREILSPYGVGDELRCVVADEYGSWGDFMLFRASDDRPFDADDAQLMRHVSDVLAGALRRHAIKSIENPEATPTETGVVLLDSRLQLVRHDCPRPGLVHGAQPRRDAVSRRDTGTRVERRRAAARRRAGP